jgi:hypothetical protein
MSTSLALENCRIVTFTGRREMEGKDWKKQVQWQSNFVSLYNQHEMVE